MAPAITRVYNTRKRAQNLLSAPEEELPPPKRAAPKKSVAKKVAAKKAAPKKVAPKKAPPKKAVPKKAIPNNVSPGNVAPERISPENSEPDNPAPVNLAPGNSVSEAASSEDIIILGGATPEKVPLDNAPTKNVIPRKAAAKETVSTTIPLLASPAEDEEALPKRKRVRRKNDPIPSPVFNPANNERRPPESDIENSGEDDDDYEGCSVDSSGLRGAKRRKVTATKGIPVARSIVVDRGIPKGQGVDYDITVGCKYQAEPCIHTPHVSEERLQELFNKIRKNIQKGITEQTINVRPYNYILPTKAQISRRKRQGALLYSEVGFADITAAKTKTTPALHAPDLIASDRERRIAKLRKTREELAQVAFKTTEVGAEVIQSSPRHEADKNEAPCALTVYDPYWSTQKEETEVNDEDYVPPSSLKRNRSPNKPDVVEKDGALVSRPIYIPSETGIEKPDSPLVETQVERDEGQSSHTTSVTSETQTAKLRSPPIVDQPSHPAYVTSEIQTEKLTSPPVKGQSSHATSITFENQTERLRSPPIVDQSSHLAYITSETQTEKLRSPPIKDQSSHTASVTSETQTEKLTSPPVKGQSSHTTSVTSEIQTEKLRSPPIVDQSSCPAYVTSETQTEKLRSPPIVDQSSHPAYVTSETQTEKLRSPPIEDRSSDPAYITSEIQAQQPSCPPVEGQYSWPIRIASEAEIKIPGSPSIRAQLERAEGQLSQSIHIHSAQVKIPDSPSLEARVIPSESHRSGIIGPSSLMVHSPINRDTQEEMSGIDRLHTAEVGDSSPPIKTLNTHFTTYKNIPSSADSMGSPPPFSSGVLGSDNSASNAQGMFLLPSDPFNFKDITPPSKVKCPKPTFHKVEKSEGSSLSSKVMGPPPLPSRILDSRKNNSQGKAIRPVHHPHPRDISPLAKDPRQFSSKIEDGGSSSSPDIATGSSLLSSRIEDTGSSSSPDIATDSSLSPSRIEDARSSSSPDIATDTSLLPSRIEDAGSGPSSTSTINHPPLRTIAGNPGDSSSENQRIKADLCLSKITSKKYSLNVSSCSSSDVSSLSSKGMPSTSGGEGLPTHPPSYVDFNKARWTLDNPPPVFLAPLPYDRSKRFGEASKLPVQGPISTAPHPTSPAKAPLTPKSPSTQSSSRTRSPKRSSVPGNASSSERHPSPHSPSPKFIIQKPHPFPTGLKDQSIHKNYMKQHEQPKAKVGYVRKITPYRSAVSNQPPKHPLGPLPRTRPAPPRTNNPTVNYWTAIKQIGEPPEATPNLGPPRPTLKLVIPKEGRFGSEEKPEEDEFDKNPSAWKDLPWK